ncbi:MAG: hypothetical protein OXC11_08660 [Rhodospirillales bacterium]|nr:hypothetical protein [Rhodospirillales bacterium]
MNTTETVYPITDRIQRRMDALITAIQKDGADPTARRAMAYEVAERVQAGHHYSSEAVAEDGHATATTPARAAEVAAKLPPFSAYQKRWLATETAARLDEAWNHPGPFGALPEGHGFDAAGAIMQEACNELVDEADRETAAFLAPRIGVDEAVALDLVHNGDFETGVGWSFTHEGVVHHLDPDMTHWRESTKTQLACEACEWTGEEGQQDPITNIWERMSPGDIFPWGDCPKCGGYVHQKGAK